MQPVCSATHCPNTCLPRTCWNNHIETLPSSLAPDSDFLATSEPMVPLFWWHPLFPSKSKGCCSHPRACGESTGLEQNRCCRLRRIQARMWSELPCVSDDASTTRACSAGFLPAHLHSRQQRAPCCWAVAFCLQQRSSSSPSSPGDVILNSSEVWGMPLSDVPNASSWDQRCRASFC